MVGAQTVQSMLSSDLMFEIYKCISPLVLIVTRLPFSTSCKILVSCSMHVSLSLLSCVLFKKASQQKSRPTFNLGFKKQTFPNDYVKREQF